MSEINRVTNLYLDFTAIRVNYDYTAEGIRELFIKGEKLQCIKIKPHIILNDERLSACRKSLIFVCFCYIIQLRLR